MLFLIAYSATILVASSTLFLTLSYLSLIPWTFACWVAWTSRETSSSSPVFISLWPFWARLIYSRADKSDSSTLAAKEVSSPWRISVFSTILNMLSTWA